MFFKIKRYSKQEKQMLKAIRQIIRTKPNNLSLYYLAMQHASVAKINSIGFKESNERLEYLGDAVLNLIVAEYLFAKYPYKNEGFLTEIRSRIVNRESLNKLAMKIGLDKLISCEKRNNRIYKSVYGDAMEAFIGALYLDKSFEFCKKFIIYQIIKQHYDIEELIETITNFKSQILEWTQKNNKTLCFKVVEQDTRKGQKQFKVRLFIDQNAISEGFGSSKKRAEQDASRKAYENIT